MSFSFGGSSGSSGGGFSFAPSTGPGGGFSFGAGTPAPSTAPAPSGGLSFGGGGPSAPAPSTTPAPGGGGFSFGGGSTTASSSTAPAPGGGGFSFGGGGAPAAPAAGSGFSFGGGSSTPAPAPTAATGGGFSLSGAPQPAAGAPSSTPPAHIKVPEFSTTFPGLTFQRKICEENCVETSSIDKLFQIKSLWNQHPANPSVRHKLVQERTVLLASPLDPNQTQEAQLTDDMLRQLFDLADDLALTEKQALSLLAKSKQQYKSSPESLYWAERKAHFDTLLFMFQKRLEIAQHPAEVDKPLVKATNELLQKGFLVELLHLIQEYTHRLSQLIEQRRRHVEEAESLMTDDVTRARQSRVFTMHIEFASQERQTAAEILFFIAYNFHLETSEVVSLFRLIRNLSDGDENNPEASPGLRAMNPHRVPSAYKNKDSQQQNPQSMWGEWHQSSSHLHEEKNPFDWQNELVEQNWEQGHPQLLRCVATLLMTAVSAVDQRQQLFDRVSGNQSAPTEDMTIRLLDEIRPVLFAEPWQAPHILGVLIQSYALVLQATNNPAISSPLSPRAGPPSPFQFRNANRNESDDSNTDIRRAFRRALEAPAEFKTFSLTRLSLIPALQIPASNSASSPAQVRVSEFLLSVLTDLTAQYFGLLLHRNPPISRAKWEIDAEEDLRLRRENQVQYRQFEAWSGTKTKLEVTPTSVDPLMRPDCMDDVLALCYDICRLNTNFANNFWAQHDLSDVLAKIDRIQVQDDSLVPGFCDLLSSLAFDSPDVVHELLSTGEAVVGSDTVQIQCRWTRILGVIRYYARELVNKGNGSAQTTSRTTTSQSDQSTMYYYNSVDSASTNNERPSSSSSTSSSVRELGEQNTLVLASHLRLIRSVASRSEAARGYLRKLSLPIANSAGQDTLWMVLFTLSSAAISPELRGLVFESLASITDGSTKEEILQSWECVENYGLLPLHKLLVYPVTITGEAPGILFPPSSTARVNEKHCKSWIPADPSFALIYEMEYIEASRGVYPSTTGFLRLLRALILAGGCPADLGGNWRRGRAGCSPYIEYVIHLVLPRATGTFGRIPALPFRSSGDRDLMLSFGLGVVAACLQRYIIPDFRHEREPTSVKSYAQMKAESEQMLTIRSLVDRTVVSVEENEFKSYLNDFVQAIPMSNNANATSNQMVSNAGVPRPKSPGFVILCELLNRTGSSLLDVIRKVLDEGLQRPNDVDEYLAAFAMYCATPPTISSAKAGVNYALKNLLLPLRTMEHLDVDMALAAWESRTLSILEILCAAACREKKFSETVEAYRGSAVVIPIVKFQTRASAPGVKKVQISQIAQLFSGERQKQRVADFVGDLIDDVEIAIAASGFLFYLEGVGEDLPQTEAFVGAMSRRINFLSEKAHGQNAESELFQVILSRSTAALRSKHPAPLLGIPNFTDGLDTMVEILGRQDFLIGSPHLAASCYQALYHAMQFESVSHMLGTRGFWASHLCTAWALVVGNDESNSYETWHSISWILCGLAEELNLLVSLSYISVPHGDTVVHRPQKYDEIINALFGEKILEDIIAGIPLSDASLSESISSAIHLVIGACVLSSSTFMNILETSVIVQILLHKLERSSYASTSRNFSLAVFLALDFNVSNMEEDPLEYIQRLANNISKGGQGGIVAAATFANVLCRLEVHPHAVPRDAVHHAARVLLRVSCATSDTSQIPVQPTTEALIARACLKPLLPILDENLVQRMLTDHDSYGQASTVVVSWIRLLEMIDVDITSLLQLVAQFPMGSDLLLERGILRALESVGERVVGHILSLEASNLEAGRIAVPKCWQGHLELMSLLLLGASHNRQMEASGQVLRILSRYEKAAGHLFSAFPNDGDTTVAYVRCCAIARDLANSNQLPLPTVPSSFRIPGIKPLSVLTLQIAENPLPPALLMTIPATLAGKRIKSELVSIAVENRKSWWESLDSSEWRAHDSLLFFYGVLAMDIARTGLEMMREDDDILTKVDVTSIARCICRNVDAVKTIVSIEQQYAASRAPDPAVTEERENLNTALNETISELLRLALVVLKTKREVWEASQNSFGEESWEEISKPIKIALDYTRLDSVCLYFPSDENNRDYITGVATMLRQLVNGE